MAYKKGMNCLLIIHVNNPHPCNFKNKIYSMLESDAGYKG